MFAYRKSKLNSCHLKKIPNRALFEGRTTIETDNRSFNVDHKCIYR